MKNTIQYVCSVFLFMMFAALTANSQQLSYHGRIIDSVTNLGLTGTVEFRVQVRTPSTSAANCLMYEEIVSRNVVNGVFVIGINTGAGTVTPLNGYTVQQVFSNKNTFGAFNLAGNCSAGGPTYSPLATDARRVSISFRAAPADPWEPLPTQTVAYVPSAIESLNVGGFSVDALMRVVDAGGNPLNVTPLNNTQYTELINTLSNNSSFYLKTGDPAVGFTGALAGDVSGTQGATSVDRIRGIGVNVGGIIAGQTLQYNGTNFVPVTDGGGTVTNVTSSNAYLTVVTGTTTPALTLNVGTAANTVAAGNDVRIVNAIQSGGSAGGDLAGTFPNPTVASVGGRTAAQINTSVTDTLAATNANTASTIVKRDASGNIAVGTVSATNASINNLRIYNAGNVNNALIQLPGTVSGDYTLTLPSTLPVAGTLLGTNSSGDLSWVNPSAIGVTNVTASSPLSSSGGSTPNITISQSSLTTNGYLSSADFTTFNNKMSTTLANGRVWVGNASGDATAQYLTASEIHSSVATGSNPWFNVAGACPTGQSLNYSAITDQITCTAYSLSGSQVTTALAAVMSGDVTMNASGDVTIRNDAITNAKILSNDISWSKINIASRPTTIAGYGITDAILTQAGGVDTMQANTLALRPAAAPANANRVYVATDTQEIFYSNGATWTRIGSANGLGGTVTSVTSGGAPIVVGGTSTDPTVSITQASGTTNGYLSSADFTTFNNKLGTTTSFSGDVTGTYNATVLANAGTAGTYARVTTDAKGRVISGVASLDLTSVVSGILPVANGGSGAGTFTAGNLLVGNGTSAFNTLAPGSNGNILYVDGGGNWVSGTPASNNILTTASTFSGDVSGTSSTITLNNTGVVASTDYTKVTVDAKGRVTTAGRLVSADISTLYGYVPANSSTSVASVNGMTGAITVATGTAGTDFNIGNAGSTVTLNFPNATTVNRGLLTSNDWTTFNAKLGTTTTFSGDVSGTYNTITLNNTGVVASTDYTKVTVDAKGRVTSAGRLSSADIAAVIGYTPVATVTTVNPIAVDNTNPSTPILSLNYSGDFTVTGGNLDLSTTGVTAGTYNRVTVDTRGRVTAGFASVDLTAATGTLGISNGGTGATSANAALNNLLPSQATNGGKYLRTDGTNSTWQNIVSTDVTTALGFNPLTSALTTGNIFVGVGGVATSVTPSGDISSITGGNIQLANTGVVASTDYTKVTVDAKGRVTNAGRLASTDITALYGYTPANGASSVSSVNGINGAVVIATGTSGSDFNITTAGQNVNLNFPNATTVNRGLLTSNDWTTFNAKLGTTTTFSGDVSGTYNTITLNNTGVVASTDYTKVTVDAKGRVTSAGRLTSTDLSSIIGYTPVSTVTAVDPIAVDNTNPSTPILSLNYSGDFTVTGGNLDLSTTGVAAGTYNRVTVNSRGRVTAGFASVDLSAATGTLGITNGGTGSTTANGALNNLLPSQATNGGKYLRTDGTNSTWQNIVSTDVTTALGYSPLSDVLTTGNIIVGVGNVATSVVPSGDVSSVTAGSFVLRNSATTRSNLGLGTAAVFNVPAAGDAGASEVVKGDDSRLTNSRAPTGAASGDLTGTYPNPTLTATGVVASTDYTKVTVDAKGRVTNAGRLVSSDISALYGYTPANGSSSVASVNGINGAVVVATGTSGSDFNITTAGQNVNLNFPSSSGTNRGLLTSNDWTTFNNKLGTATTFSGDVTGTYNTITLNNTGVVASTDYTKVTVDAKGRVTSAGRLTSTDLSSIIGYTPVSTVTAVDPIAVDNTNPSTPILSLNYSGDFTVTSSTLDLTTTGVAAGTYNRVTVDTRGRVTAGFASVDLTAATGTLGISNGGTGATSANAALNNLLPSQATNGGKYLRTDGTNSTWQNIVSTDVTSALGYSPLSNVLTTGNIIVGVGNVATSVVPSGDISSITGGNIQLAATGVVASTDYTKVTVDAKGRVTNAGRLVSSDISALYGYTPANGSSSVASVNGVNGAVVIATGTSGSDFNITTAGQNVNLNFPNATTVNRGLLTSNDWTTFNNKIGSGTAASGDLTGTYPNPTLAAVGTAGTYAVVTTDTKGRVTSGVASLDLTTRVSGILPVANGGSGAGTFTAGNLLVGNGTSAFNTLAPGSNGNVMYVTGGAWTSGTPAAANLLTTTTAFSGDVTGTYNTIALNNTGVVASTDYTKVTVDAKGRVTSAGRLTSTDLSSIIGYTPVSTVTAVDPIAVDNTNPSTPILSLNYSGDFTVTSSTLDLTTTGVAAGTYNRVTVDTRGRVTAGFASVDLTAATGTLGISNGGTGATSANAALNNLLPSQATNGGKYLRTDGTNSTWQNIVSTDVTSALGYSPLSNVLTTGNIIVGVGNVATSVVPSGDVSSVTAGSFVLRNSATTRSNLGLGTAAVFNVPAAGDAGASEVVKGDDSRLTNSRAPTGAASGDLTGTYPNPTLTATGVVASTDYTKVTVDAKGRVTNAGRLVSSDISALYGYTPANGSSSVASVNGLNGAIIIATGTSGSDFNIGNAGSTVTLNFPNATTVNRGLLTSNDWTTFNNKIGSGTTASGDLTGTYPNPTLAAVGTAGTYSVVTTDTKGRVTSGVASLDLTTRVSGILPVANGGSGAGTFTAGNLLVGNGTSAFNTLAPGSNGNVMYVTGGAWTSGTPAAANLLTTTTAFSGDVTGTYNTITLNNTGVVASTDYTKVTVDAKGRVTSAGRLTSTDLSSIIGYTPVSTVTAVDPIAVDNTNPSTPILSLNYSGDFTVTSSTLDLTTTGVAAGTYNRVTVDTRGRVTAGFASVDLTAATGTLGISNGGTGATSANAALNNLLPSQATNGGKYLRTDGTNSTWQNIVSTDVTSALGYSPLSNVLTTGNIIVGVGNVATSVSPSGDISSITGGNIQLAATGVVASTDYTKVTVDAKGRVTNAGRLVSSDISALYGYTPASSAGVVTSVTAAGTANNPITIGGTATAPTIDIPRATTAVNGYLSSTDWTTFNDKLGLSTAFSGDVTGTYNATTLATVATAGTYAGPVTIDAKGRVITATASLDLSTGNVTGVLPVARGGSGAGTFGAGELLVGNGTSAFNTLAPGSNGNVMYVTGGAWTSGTPTTANLVTLTGVQTISGGKGFTSFLQMSDATTLRFADADSSNYVGLRAPATVNTNLTWTLPSGDGTSGQMLTTNGSGTLQWANPGTVTSVTAAGTANNPIVIGGTAAAPTIDIPMATTSVNGYLSSTDWTAFNSKLTGSLATGSIFVGVGGVATAVAPSGDISSITGGNIQLATAGTAGTYALVTTDTKGRVTSGVASLDLTTRVTGTLPVANGGTGTTSIGAGNIAIGNGTGAVTSLAAGTAGNVVYATGVAAWSSGSPDTAGLVDKTSTQSISGAKSFSNFVQMNAQNDLRYADSDSSNYVSFRAPATVNTNVTWTLPSGDGTSGQLLSTSGAGVLSWVTGLTGATTFSGDVTGTSSTMTLATVATAGTYAGPVTIDVKGRVTSAVASLDLSTGNVTGTLPIARGGTGATTVANNLVFVGPNGGGPLAPSFRALVSADVSAAAFVPGGNSLAGVANFGTNDNNALIFRTNNVTRGQFTAAGAFNVSSDLTVGVANTTIGNNPDNAGTLQVNGQGFSRVITSSGASPLTWNTNNGNTLRWTQNAAAPTINIHNMKPGGAYMLVIDGDDTSNGTVTINCFSDAGTTGMTEAFVPTNGARVTSGTLDKTIYTLMYDGADCMITWITGY